MYGIKEFTAVINPPQSSILAVGVGEERAVVRNGKIEVATLMSATLACDHRASTARSARSSSPHSRR